MTEQELSREEEIHLYNLSLIPAGLVLIAFLISLVYLMHSNSFITIWDMVGLIIPFWWLIAETIFFSFEVLYQRKSNRPFDWKRLIGRTTIGISAFGLFVIIMYLFGFFFASTGESNLLILASITWFVVWAVLLFNFRKKFSELEKGSW